MVGLRDAYRRGDASPVDAVDACIRRIEVLDGRVGAVTTTTFERARRDAAECERDLARGGLVAPLHGIPVLIKEIYDVAEAETTYGSAALRGRVPAHDADAVARLRRAGAIVLGLTRSHEVAWGITTQSERMGGTRNPWDLGRVPGGSSGGSAAAVALGYAPLALGSDTGGSIRIPACFCGVPGFKVSFGAIPLRGVCPLAPSLDHGGFLARRVADLAVATRAVTGRDLPLSPGTVSALRVGVCPDLEVVPLADDHRRVFETSIGAAASLGSGVVEVRFPEAEHLYDIFSRIQLFEAYRVHTEELRLLPEHADDYSESVVARLARAREVTVDDYRAACAEREAVRERFASLFEEVDVLVTPVTAGGPSSVERPNFVERDGTSVPFRDQVMHFTVPHNLAGLPACAVPAGFDADGLPVAVQVCAPPGEDARCLAAAAVLEDVLGAPGWPPMGEP